MLTNWLKFGLLMPKVNGRFRIEKLDRLRFHCTEVESFVNIFSLPTLDINLSLSLSAFDELKRNEENNRFRPRLHMASPHIVRRHDRCSLSLHKQLFVGELIHSSRTVSIQSPLAVHIDLRGLRGTDYARIVFSWWFTVLLAQRWEILFGIVLRRSS